MKFNWHCLLFGHHFLGESTEEINGIDWSVKSPRTYCVKCGLTKKEIFGEKREVLEEGKE